MVTIQSVDVLNLEAECCRRIYSNFARRSTVARAALCLETAWHTMSDDRRAGL